MSKKLKEGPRGNCGIPLKKFYKYCIWTGTWRCPPSKKKTKKCPFSRNTDFMNKCLMRIFRLEDYKGQMEFNRRIARKLTKKEIEQSFEGYELQIENNDGVIARTWVKKGGNKNC